MNIQEENGESSVFPEILQKNDVKLMKKISNESKLINITNYPLPVVFLYQPL